VPGFKDLDTDFNCPYQHRCPYLEGLSTQWIWQRYQATVGLECQYEYILEQQNQELAQTHAHNRKLERENQQLRAQLRALHQRQFKGRHPAPTVRSREVPAGQTQKRGAPVGHPPWQRAHPKQLDRIIRIQAPERCPHCHRGDLQPVPDLHDHVQEDILLEPRTVVTCFRHQSAYCPDCNRQVWQLGPGELPGAYIGPAAKATAIYLRYKFHASDRKLSEFFADFFGLRFVPASAYGFERQAVRRGTPLYADLLEKVRALAVAHADETSWRHNGQSYWVWYVGNDDLACFKLDAHRSTQAAQSLLGQKFAGVIVADAYAAYQGVHPQDWQSCLAHIKTKAKELGQELALLKGPAVDGPARHFCQQVQGFIHTTCQAHQRLTQGPWRAQAARRQERTLRRRLRTLCRTPLRYPRAETFRQRLLGPEQKHLFTCFRRPKVPPTNNQAERSLRPVVIMRKVIQGTRSERGLENHSVLRSLFETARRQGRKPHEFFLDLFTRDTPQAQAALYGKSSQGKARPP
jgi:transposase